MHKLFSINLKDENLPIQRAFFSEPYLELTNIKKIFISIVFTKPTNMNFLFINEKEMQNQKIFAKGNSSYLSEPFHLETFSALFPQIDTTDSENVSRIDFLVEEEPIRKIRLAIVVCTFHKEEYVKKNIATLQKWKEIQPNKSLELILVDNAKTLDQKIFPDFVTVIPNRNLGGAGGFTKGILHSLEKNCFDRILLMDDDLSFTPQTLDRLYSILEYSLDSEIVLSGGMMDSLVPNTLYEAATRIDFSKLIYVPGQKEIDLSNIVQLLPLLKSPKPDFAPWWFASFSIASIQKNGLPLPFFIRGDDLEYGYRMKKAGHSVCNIPGMVVWHEPFYVKNPEWIYYYHYRNFLITTALHRDEVPLRGFLLMFVRVFLEIFFFRYAKAEFILKGWKDFYMPIETFLELQADKKQAELLLAVKNDSDKKILMEDESRFLKKINIFQTEKQYPFQLLPLIPLIKGLIVRNPYTQVSIYYQRNWKRGFRIMFQLFRVLFDSFRNYKSTKIAWRKVQTQLTSKEFWKRYTYA